MCYSVLHLDFTCHTLKACRPTYCTKAPGTFLSMVFRASSVSTAFPHSLPSSVVTSTKPVFGSASQECTTIRLPVLGLRKISLRGLSQSPPQKKTALEAVSAQSQVLSLNQAEDICSQRCRTGKKTYLPHQSFNTALLQCTFSTAT